LDVYACAFGLHRISPRAEKYTLLNECIFNVSYYGCLYRSTSDLTRLANRGKLSKKRNFKMAGYFTCYYKIKKVTHRRGKFGNSAILTLETKNGDDFRLWALKRLTEDLLEDGSSQFVYKIGLKTSADSNEYFDYELM